MRRGGRDNRRPASAPRPKARLQNVFLAHPAVPLAAILLLAALVRTGALLDWVQGAYRDFLVFDEAIYHGWALRVLQGGEATFPVADFPPLPGYLMLAAYRLLSPDPLVVRILNLLFGVATCGLIYLIGRRLADWRIGLLAAAAAALYKPFIFYSVTLLKESLGLLLFAAVVVLLLRGMARPAFAAGLWLGVAAGLLINVRQNMVVILPLLPLLLLWGDEGRQPLSRRLRAAGAVLLGLALSVAPFALQQRAVSGEWGLTSVGGFNLYLANNPDSPIPYYRPVRFASSVPADQGVQFVIEASRREGRRLTPAEASRFWTREVLRGAWERPGPFAQKLWRKALTTVNRSEADDNYHIGFTSRFVPFLRLPFLAVWCVLPLGVAGMLGEFRRSRQTRALCVIALVYLLSLVVFFSSARIRLPLLVILLPYAILLLSRCWAAVRGGEFRRVKVPAGLVGLFGALAFVPVLGADDMTSYYNTHALNLQRKGLVEEAAEYWRASAAMDRPYSAYANLALARLHYQQGDAARGDASLARIGEASFAAAAKHELRGDALAGRRDPAGALQAYRQSLAINSGQRSTRIKLIRAARVAAPETVAREEAMLAEIDAFYPAWRR